MSYVCLALKEEDKKEALKSFNEVVKIEKENPTSKSEWYENYHIHVVTYSIILLV